MSNSFFVAGVGSGAHLPLIQVVCIPRLFSLMSAGHCALSVSDADRGVVVKHSSALIKKAFW